MNKNIDIEYYKRLLSEAFDYVVNGNNSAALEKIKILETLGPKPVAVILLEGCALGGLGRFQDAVEIFRSAIKKITESKTLKDEDRQYLIAYAKTIGTMAEKYCSNIEKSSFLPIDYSQIDLSKVSKKWLRNFSLDKHPEWDSQFLDYKH